MEQLHTDPIDSGNATGQPGKESLSAYVERMETEENLRKLAMKLTDDLKKPVANEHPQALSPDVSTRDVSTRDVSTPDLSFEKFEEKRKRRDGQ